METFPVVIYLRTIWMVWLLVFFCFTNSLADFDWYDPPAPVVYTYNRFAEIQEKCRPLLSWASELEPDDHRGSRIKKEHSFESGDWDQESGGAPLMPFDDRDMQRKHEGPGAFLKLASFWVVDVDPVRRAQNMVGVSGIMEIGITGHQHFDYRPFEYRHGWSPNFRMNPGFSSMRIIFEGVYIESEENGGERLICSLGTSVIPTTNQYTQSLELADGYGYNLENQPPLVQDDQIMLVLRYSKSFNLTTGNVSGEMQSLHDKSSFKYFDRVHISSQLGHHSKYQFGAEELLSKVCSPYPYQDSLVDEDIFSFTYDNFCKTVQHFLSNGIFEIVPSWKSVGSKDDAAKLGPFIISRKTKATDGGSNNFRLLVQNLHCDPGIDENKIKTARVFALFRAIHSWENAYTSEGRIGLSGMTLSAEGMWRSSEGQLCMVGCLGIVATTSDRCNSRICLYFPLTFSINQRSPIFGTITSTSDPESYTPLWFGTVTQPEIMLLGMYQGSTTFEWSYKYSKIIQAKAFHMRSKPSFLGTSMRKSFLEYPSQNGSDIVSPSLLANELSLRVSAVPYVFYKSQRIHVVLEILSLGSFFGPYWPRRCRSYPEVEKSVDLNADMIETSGLLSIFGEHFNNISLSFEGIYDSSVGNLYLIGCRDVRVSQKNIKEEMNLEGGMDCLFEIKVEYPPTNARWLKNPEVKISISSKRSKEDFLYFNPVSLKTKPISYHKHLPDVIFRKTFEETLRVLMLIIAIFCTRSQLHHLNNVDRIGYISLTMIHIPVVEYISPLVCSGEIFFKWKAFQSDSYRTYDFKSYERFNVFTYTIKSLSLYALLLTFNLGKKVSESRTRQIGSDRIQQSRLQNEKKIFLVTSAFHIIGFLVTHVIHAMIAIETVPLSGKNVHRRSKLLQWLTELDGYLCLIPDLFLLPQIVANTLWHNKGKHPRKLYYLGLTCLRVLLHVYDCIRETVPDHIDDEYGYHYTNMDLYSRFVNILLIIIVIILAVILYSQQKSNRREFSLEVQEE